jgi:hypothetical protein
MKTKTVYPPNHVKDVDEGQAHAWAERRKMFKTAMYNRLRITECIREYNIKVQMKARQISEQEDDLLKSQRDAIYKQYLDRHKMTKLKLAGLVWPSMKIGVATGYLSQYNNGTRFTSFEPWVLFSIAATLNCHPCDLIESIA